MSWLLRGLGEGDPSGSGVESAQPPLLLGQPPPNPGSPAGRAAGRGREGTAPKGEAGALGRSRTIRSRGRIGWRITGGGGGGRAGPRTPLPRHPESPPPAGPRGRGPRRPAPIRHGLPTPSGVACPGRSHPLMANRTSGGSQPTAAGAGRPGPFLHVRKRESADRAAPRAARLARQSADRRWGLAETSRRAGRRGRGGNGAGKMGPPPGTRRPEPVAGPWRPAFRSEACLEGVHNGDHGRATPSRVGRARAVIIFAGETTGRPGVDEVRQRAAAPRCSRSPAFPRDRTFRRPTARVYNNNS